MRKWLFVLFVSLVTVILPREAFAAGSENIINIPAAHQFPPSGPDANIYQNFEFFASSSNRIHVAYAFIPANAASSVIHYVSNTNDPLPVWVGVRFKTDMYHVNKFSMTFRNSGIAYRPSKVIFQGSDNGSTWVDVKPETTLNWATETLTFDVPETKYQQYRWYFPAGAVSKNVGLTALQIYGYPALPPPPYNLVSSNVTNHTADLSWDAVTDAISYNVYRNGALLANVNATNYKDKDLRFGTDYNYQISAIRASGLEYPLSPVMQVTTLSVKPDYQLSMTSATNNTITINWMAVPNAQYYRVYEDSKMIANNVTATSYTHKGLDIAKTYRYQVMAVYAGGIDDPLSDVLTAQTTSIDTTPPDRPELINIVNGFESGTATWKANTEPDLAGYNVYVNGVKHNSFLLSNLTYRIDNLVNGTSYSITVTAVDYSGNESLPSNAMIMLPTSKAIPPVSMTWTLKDIVDGVSNWFGSIWLILAFCIAIPLSFYVGNRVKGLFV
ncbi:hypothetical protein [Brevibacillus reuszeri]|uniref:hypothetical protein n=1 Tax=Brevibacillus reuszeri TaxID=54915 RepID=UPI000CCBE9B5|nr:hypothetical protein [Brevibacillus reuszeri]